LMTSRGCSGVWKPSSGPLPFRTRLCRRGAEPAEKLNLSTAERGLRLNAIFGNLKQAGAERSLHRVVHRLPVANVVARVTSTWATVQKSLQTRTNFCVSKRGLISWPLEGSFNGRQRQQQREWSIQQWYG